MCGIAGCVSFKSGLTEEDIRKLERINEGLKHRGPDAHGLIHDRFVGLAHRRLSIIDLSEAANQPMSSVAGSVHIVFNGEIYNYDEIRKELERDYPFRTDHSDTETIIYAYQKWGIDCVKRFRGMFAIAIYDQENSRVYLVRDRLGKKPLYYCANKDKIWFASELYPMLNVRVIEKKINDEAIYHYLSLFTVNAPDTFFQGIRKLEAGHYLCIDRAGLKDSVYWDVADWINKETVTSYEDAIINTRRLLEESMRLRNISDVPVSIALSGGVDSALNLHYSALVNRSNLSAINIAYEVDNKYNESHIAEKLCSRYGVPLDIVRINPENLRQAMAEYLSIQKDMPFGDMNTVLMYIISRHARSKGKKVLLVGEGGDELGGYPVYARINMERRILECLPYVSSLKDIIPYRYRYMVDCCYGGTIVARRNIHGFMEVLKKDFWKKNLYSRNSYDILLKYAGQINEDHKDIFYRKILCLEYKLRLPEMLLPRIDYPTMACGVEARSPYLDHLLIEYTAGLDYSLKMKHGAKSIIKQIAKDNLPFDISKLPKVGFGMLMDGFIKYDLEKLFDEECNIADAPIREYIDIKALFRVFEKIGLKNRPKPKLWLLYALNSWLKGVL
jgi:asparagine synthase (glutamine-hydrolysing)